MSGERSGDEHELDHAGRLRLPSVGRILQDLASGAAFLRRVLPEIAADLQAIRGHVASMDPEMLGMHAAVKRIEGEIAEMSGRIEELGEHMMAVEQAVERLEPHVADVNLAMRPLRRARARMRPAPERQDGTLDDRHTEEAGGSS